MESLGFYPEMIDTVFLSHEHKDHTGGLNKLLERKQGIEFYIPFPFSPELKERIQKGGGRVVEIREHAKICFAAFSTGIISGWIPEQSLVLSDRSGLVLLTGCAHPRITNIIFQTKIIFGENPCSVIGGFHLAGFSRPELQEIVDVFKDSNISRVGPCHCTGKEAREMFQKAYQYSFIDIGVGKEILL
jgi:7,8-dihydropterin-6-yl-methyl-4-(beta-D-ribofuranosyl)aminobenzene 5'-phosphate synthase